MKRIAVCCGASKGHDPPYVQKAHGLGKYFAERDYKLISDTRLIGIMSAIQDGVLDHGGKATGVMPKVLDKHEITNQRLAELILIDSVYERKNKMTGLADAFVMAPGGTGSLEEFFEMYSWTQIGIREKPIVIYNINSFSNPLQTTINHMIEEGFIGPKCRAFAPLCDAKESSIESILNFKPLGTHSYD